jgi:hypothetical protein
MVIILQKFQLVHGYYIFYFKNISRTGASYKNLTMKPNLSFYLIDVYNVLMLIFLSSEKMNFLSVLKKKCDGKIK